jgi:L,D-peptidoglycan transpeptidase YkuD (ErfK/YbiS/YcfS/YnhG family)
MMRKLLFPLLLSFAPLATGKAAVPSPWASEGTQMVLVIAPDWQTASGHLRTFERRKGQWHAAGIDFPVSTGKNGAGWGLGLHESPNDGPFKAEGDGKAPAGIFQIGMAFGQAASLPTGLDYRAMIADDWCIDVNDSPLYNRIVSVRDVGPEAIAGSSEPMRRDIHSGDHLYNKGFMIAHNPENRPKGGSCIFAHLWRSPGAATAGCTAMTEPDMDRLLLWLNQSHNPVFVLLPDTEFQRFKTPWQLPDLSLNK